MKNIWLLFCRTKLYANSPLIHISWNYFDIWHLLKNINIIFFWPLTRTVPLNSNCYCGSFARRIFRVCCTTRFAHLWLGFSLNRSCLVPCCFLRKFILSTNCFHIDLSGYLKTTLLSLDNLIISWQTSYLLTTLLSFDNLIISWQANYLLTI